MDRCLGQEALAAWQNKLRVGGLWHRCWRGGRVRSRSRIPRLGSLLCPHEWQPRPPWRLPERRAARPGRAQRLRHRCLRHRHWSRHGGYGDNDPGPGADRQPPWCWGRKFAPDALAAAGGAEGIGGRIPHSPAGGFYPLAGLAVLAMGLQTSALQRISAKTVRTTYVELLTPSAPLEGGTASPPAESHEPRSAV
jgi:hypothetical protein